MTVNREPVTLTGRQLAVLDYMRGGNPFGVSDCDECGATEVPIAWANDEGFEKCQDCAAPVCPQCFEVDCMEDTHGPA